jgi:hypothetical protein
MAPALLAGGAASAATPAVPAGREASIPFVNTGSIRDWRADGTHGLYVQDLRNRWYYAELMGPCSDLPFANAVGFETRGIDTLDKFGTVIVRGQRCAFSSFVTSDGPPRKAKKDHKG